ncbi:MAG TPA: hypothetical protein VNY10_09190, partial [Roseiarcus sp.]|nr:hypothetical protein [Roseiarcus sp.]
MGSLTLSEFTADRRAFYAAPAALEIISEAARRLAPSVRERHPSFPGARSSVSETFCATIMMMS